MKKLLLLLPLIFSAPVLAQSDPLGFGRSAAERYTQHMTNANKFSDLNDWEMACSELRMADLELRVNFSQLQQYDPTQDWFGSRTLVKRLLEKFCS